MSSIGAGDECNTCWNKLLSFSVMFTPWRTVVISLSLVFRLQVHGTCDPSCQLNFRRPIWEWFPTKQWTVYSLCKFGPCWGNLEWHLVFECVLRGQWWWWRAVSCATPFDEPTAMYLALEEYLIAALSPCRDSTLWFGSVPMDSYGGKWRRWSSDGWQLII